MRCEDYPCCGHTFDDPCEPQWYDAPGAFDTSVPGNEHALCEHEFGICDVWEDEDDEPEDFDDDDWRSEDFIDRSDVRNEPWSFDPFDGFPYPPE